MPEKMSCWSSLGIGILSKISTGPEPVERYLLYGLFALVMFLAGLGYTSMNSSQTKIETKLDLAITSQSAANERMAKLEQQMMDHLKQEEKHHKLEENRLVK